MDFVLVFSLLISSRSSLLIPCFVLSHMNCDHGSSVVFPIGISPLFNLKSRAGPCSDSGIECLTHKNKWKCSWICSICCSLWHTVTCEMISKVSKKISRTDFKSCSADWTGKADTKEGMTCKISHCLHKQEKQLICKMPFSFLKWYFWKIAYCFRIGCCQGCRQQSRAVQLA